VVRPPVDVDARGTLSTSGFNRNGSPRNHPLELGVIHDTESGDLKGVGDIGGVIQWWKNPASGGAAHIVVDAEGNSGLGGRLDYKMPHVGWYNYNSIGIELIGRATFSRLFWLGRDKQLHRAARWMAFINKSQGLPIQRGKIDGKTLITPGWLMHRDFRGLGTDHSDPGPFFPFDRLIGMANWYRTHGWVE
jgi:N-acetyl-anhydromuramyl-L-alanine amidase AmpD